VLAGQPQVNSAAHRGQRGMGRFDHGPECSRVGPLWARAEEAVMGRGERKGVGQRKENYFPFSEMIK
jgi:hypothetical protein